MWFVHCDCARSAFAKLSSRCLKASSPCRFLTGALPPKARTEEPVCNDQYPILFSFHSISLKLMKPRLKRAWICYKILSSTTALNAGKWSIVSVIIGPTKAPSLHWFSYFSLSCLHLVTGYSDIITLPSQMMSSIVFHLQCFL